jgi:hypothetical protein
MEVMVVVTASKALPLSGNMMLVDQSIFPWIWRNKR